MGFYSKDGSTPILYESVLEEDLDDLDLIDMINLAFKSKIIENLCIKVWQDNPLYFNNIMDNHGLTGEAATFFICKNASNFRSLELSTSNIQAFNEATRNLEEIDNLEKLFLINDSKLSELVPAEFLILCVDLDHVRICYPIASFYMGSILQLPSLQRLEICHHGDADDSNDLLKMIIAAKGSSIIYIQTHIDVFPPRWLTKSAMDNCQNLKGLILKGRNKPMTGNRDYFNMEIPGIKSLEMLWYIGQRHCLKYVMDFVSKCPKIRYFYTNLNDIFNIYKITIMQKRRLEGNETPFDYRRNTGVVENITKIDFVWDEF